MIGRPIWWEPMGQNLNLEPRVLRELSNIVTHISTLTAHHYRQVFVCITCTKKIKWNILKHTETIQNPKVSSYIYTYCMNLYDTVCIYIYTIYICTYEQRPTRFMKPLHERSFGGTCCPNHGKQYGELLKSITWFDGEVERCWCVSQPCGIVQ